MRKPFAGAGIVAFFFVLTACSGPGGGDDKGEPEPSTPKVSSSNAAMPKPSPPPTLTPGYLVGDWNPIPWPTGEAAGSSMTLTVKKNGEVSTVGAPLDFYEAEGGSGSFVLCSGDTNFKTEPATLTIRCLNLDDIEVGPVDDYKADIVAIKPYDSGTKKALMLKWKKSGMLDFFGQLSGIGHGGRPDERDDP